MNQEGEHPDGGSESSRRAFVKGGTLAAGALVLGLSEDGRAAAQVDGDETDQRALLYRTDFRAGARFRVISPPIDWRPVGDDPLFEPDLFEDFDTRAILYVSGDQGDGGDGGNGNGGGDEIGGGDENGEGDGNGVESPRFFFPWRDAEAQEGQVYELGEDFTPVGDAEDLFADVLAENRDAGEGLIVVTFTTVTDETETTTTETETTATGTETTATEDGTPEES